MSFFSKLDLEGRFLEIVRRFPIVILFALVTTVTLIVLLDNNYGDLFKWPVSAFIGFLAMLNWSLFREAYLLSVTKYWIGVLVILALLGIYYLQMPSDFSETKSCFWFFTIGLSMILHFLVAVIPFFKTWDNSMFTTFNISVFIAWMQAALYGIVLYLALSLAMLALDQLFEINIKSIFYFKLFIIVTGIFHTTFFLSELPSDLHKTDLPPLKSIFRIFTTYVAVPITLLYGIILYAYIIRMAISDGPMVDWVFVMVLWYFLAGILTWLFTQYYNNDSDHSLMSVFRTYFFPLSIIPAVLLFTSLYKNMIKAGIKEELYLTAICAAFIGCICIYMILPGRKDHRIFPVLLILLSIVAFWSGPWSVCTLPVTHQQHRLISDLQSKGLIKDGILMTDTLSMLKDTNGILSGHLYFLESRNALSFIKEYDKNGLIKVPADSVKAYHLLNLWHLDQYNIQKSQSQWEVVFPDRKTIDSRGYEKIIPLYNPYSQIITTDYIMLDENGQLKLIAEGKDQGKLSIHSDIYKMSQNPAGGNVTEEVVSDYAVKIIVYSAVGKITQKDTTVTNCEALVLLKKIIK